MSAKPAKKGAKPAPSAPADVPAPSHMRATAAAAATAQPEPSWIDSSDPKKRRWGQIVLIAVWIYVAALWLLALDQTFHWGIFGPKVPALP